MADLTFMIDCDGNRHNFNLNDNVLATDVFEPEDKVVTDTVVEEAFEQFRSNNFTNVADFTSSSKAPTGQAVATYVQNQLSGSTGGFLGNMTVAQINALTSIHTGDSVCSTDSGTITLGSVVVVAGDELAFTTSGVWVKKLSTYVRPSDYATTTAGGTILSSPLVNGNVQVDETTGIASVVGWSGKVDDSTTGLNILLTHASTQASTISDSDVLYLHQSNTTKNTLFGTLWTWIAGKISSVLGLTASDYDGNANTATTATSSNYVNDYAWTSSGSTNQGLQVGWAGSAVTECTPDSSLTATTSHNLCCYIKSGNQVMLKDVDISDVKSGDSAKTNGYTINVVESGESIPTTSGYITLVKV